MYKLVIGRHVWHLKWPLANGGPLILFNVYVALSWSSDRKTIRLLRGFDKKIFFRAQDESLLVEDGRPERLNEVTRWAYEKVLGDQV